MMISGSVRTLLLVTAFFIAAFAIVAGWANALAQGQPSSTEKKVVAPQNPKGSGCRVEVGGRIVELLPGQGIRTETEWRNCQTYEGHSLIVYSSRPPNRTAVETGG